MSAKDDAIEMGRIVECALESNDTAAAMEACRLVSRFCKEMTDEQTAAVGRVIYPTRAREEALNALTLAAHAIRDEQTRLGVDDLVDKAVAFAKLDLAAGIDPLRR